MSDGNINKDSMQNPNGEDQGAENPENFQLIKECLKVETLQRPTLIPQDSFRLMGTPWSGPL